jgi:ABC-type transporter Mla MlaB component
MATDQLTLANASQFLANGRAQIQAGNHSFDLAGLKSVDSSALACLLELARQSDACKFENPPESLLNLARLYGVEQILF